jgi:hypothetical protein
MKGTYPWNIDVRLGGSQKDVNQKKIGKLKEFLDGFFPPEDRGGAREDSRRLT